MAPAADLELRDYGPARERLLSDALAGLLAPRKSLPCKYFYDERGSALFERICELEEYYPTRTELAILRARAGAMAAALGPDCLVVEYGSGSGVKTQLLLGHLERPVAYVPVDISREHLRRSAAALSARYPALPVLPVCADFTQPFALPSPPRPPRRRAAYFPGSTIGNFAPAEARKFLTQVAELCGPGGALLIGVDLKKSRAVLERAYDDALGVTAAFNVNLLRRLNRELGADFRLDQFAHRALWNEVEGRVEMHLVSRCAQQVRLAGRRIRFEPGETIHTENSYKYDLRGFSSLARSAGFEVEQVWVDGGALFSVQALRVV
ncbi:MAG TPA: L-histidine N(alpha)-methyltransferase [Myxococcota bacterium]|jgi:dimethylhistidine N-methyltransferase|nr:L-histidine N(alpha)-methyltransferase [Myxococcota bacterium]